MKTVVEGGTTVQVTTHDVSDSEEEEEENVYNVTVHFIHILKFTQKNYQMFFTKIIHKQS